MSELAANLRVRASVVCENGGRILTVRSIDPVTGAEYLFLPGGAIEAGESATDAAVRETREETGYAVRLVGKPIVADYGFDWAGRVYPCRTSFFKAELIDATAAPGPTLFDPILHGVVWTAAADAESTFAYHATIADAVRRLRAIARSG